MLSCKELRALVLSKRKELSTELQSLQDRTSTQLHNQCFVSNSSEKSSTGYLNQNNEQLKDDLDSETSALKKDDRLNAEIRDNLECNSTEPTLNITKLLRKYSCPNIGMLRKGEYSPNNPELAGDGRVRGGDVFLGLGLYEEKRKKLMQKRQVEYREYLAKQSQLNSLKNQRSKRLPPGRNLFLEDDNKDYLKDWRKNGNNVDGNSRRPSSVGVQTDPEDFALMALERRPNNAFITQAERELSPRPSVHSNNNPTDWRMLVEKVNIGTQNNLIVPPSVTGNKNYIENREIASKNYVETGTDNEMEKLKYQNDFMDPFNNISNNLFRNDSPRARLLQDLRHTYMPSLFDVDAIRQRNVKAEEEAAAKRTAYQLELKKQIEEQQRIREEKKAREKMLEEAETRRLEEQLRMLKLTQENEIQKQKELAIRIRADSNEFEKRRLALQNEIDIQKKNIKNVKSKYTKTPSSEPSVSTSGHVDGSKIIDKSPSFSNLSTNKEIDSDILSYNVRRNNPFVGQDISRQRAPYSTNIPEKSVFNQSIPVRNFNANDYSQRFSNEYRSLRRPDYKSVSRNERPKYEPAFLNKKISEMIDVSNVEKKEFDLEDSLPIPVLRVPDKVSKNNLTSKESDNVNSEAMKNLERKWQIPAVQKNILKNNLNEDGKQENILTQLGSIRRQLQLEQLKLDQSQFFNKQKLVK